MTNPRLYGDVDEHDDARDLSSRSDARRENRELEEKLARVAKQLVELRPALLEKLALAETMLDVVRDAQAMRDPRARNRQLRLVRAALRENDWSLIAARVEAVLKHGVVPAALATESGEAARALEWTARLIGGGSDAIEAVLLEYPSADRTHLRNLVREVHKANADRRAKAEARLTQAVRQLIR